MRDGSAEAMRQGNTACEQGGAEAAAQARAGDDRRGTAARHTLPICLGNVTSSSSVGHAEGTGIEFPRVAVQHELSRNVVRTAPHVVIIGEVCASIKGEIDDSMTKEGYYYCIAECAECADRFIFSPNQKLPANFETEANRPPNRTKTPDIHCKGKKWFAASAKRRFRISSGATSLDLTSLE